MLTRAGFMALRCSKLYDNVHSGALVNSQRMELLKKQNYIFKKQKYLMLEVLLTGSTEPKNHCLTLDKMENKTLGTIITSYL